MLFFFVFIRVFFSNFFAWNLIKMFFVLYFLTLRSFNVLKILVNVKSNNFPLISQALDPMSYKMPKFECGATAIARHHLIMRKKHRKFNRHKCVRAKRLAVSMHAGPIQVVFYKVISFSSSTFHEIATFPMIIYNYSNRWPNDIERWWFDWHRVNGNWLCTCRITRNLYKLVNSFEIDAK